MPTLTLTITSAQVAELKEALDAPDLAGIRDRVVDLITKRVIENRRLKAQMAANSFDQTFDIT